MSWTIRRLTHRGTRCAVMVCLLTSILLVRCGAVARAEDDFGLADNGLYLISGSGHQQGPFTGTYDLNSVVGAQRFYNAGFTGTNAVMANIEAGYAWSGHETLSHVQQIPTSGALGDVDRHATWVASVMGGRPTSAGSALYQRGLAPNAQLFSGAIATSWPGGISTIPRYTTRFFVNFGGLSTFGPYRASFITGLTGTRTADVINTSWIGGNDQDSLTASDTLSGTLDALLYENPRTMLVTSAGNTTPSGAGPNRVPSPASAYNDLTVAALTPNGGAYNLPSSFSNGGPNDYADPINGFFSEARQVVDIAAPGENFSTAYYGGQTGGNGPNVFGPPDGPAGGPDWYSRNVNGTSFSAPTVTGGAALLYDAAYSLLAGTPDARDNRVMKAVLMNSADKTQGWNNGQVAHPNGNGGVLTTQSLDNRVGAGRLNLDRAYDQFLSGTTDVAGTATGFVGSVQKIGWDFGQVVDGATNDYLLAQPLLGGSTFTATLDWFRHRETFGLSSFSDVSYDNLNLELWSTLGGTPLALVAESRSQYNNAEHFSFAIPTTGEYLLRVRLAGEIFDRLAHANSDFYGLAWSGVTVPEPASLAMAMTLLAILLLRRRQIAA